MPAPRRTAPLGMLVGAVQSIRKSVLPAAAGAYGLRDQFAGFGFVGAFAVFALAIGGLGAVIKWWRTTYVVGPEDIRLESGLVSRAARAVPYDRIQDVSLEQSPVARLLGLAEVRFETGAGGADEIALAWLPLAEGEALRELVRERREREAPAAEVPAEVEAPVLFAMDSRRLATFGLFEFSLAAFAVAAGAAQQFDQFLPFDVWDRDLWEGAVGAQAARVTALGPVAEAGAILAALAVLAVVGLLTGLARTFLRDWGFVLERTAKGFRRRRGLFTKTDVMMPAHRVQAVELRTGWLRRRFGWHALKFVSLAQDAGNGSHVVAPFAQIEEIAPIARAAGFALPDEATEWHRPAKRAFVDRAIVGSLVPVAASIALLFSDYPLLAVLPLLLVPLAGLRQALLWRRAKHALDGTQVYARRGWFAPRTDVASRVKLQTVEIVQGPLARRGGYATLHLGLAGGHMAFGAVPIVEARRIRDAVLASMARVDFSRIS